MSWLSFRIDHFAGKEALEKHNWKKAKSNLKKALEAIPSHPDTTLLLAQASWADGCREEARRLLEELIENHDTFSPAYFLRAKFSQEEKNFESARQDFEKAASLEPKNAEAWHELGKSLLSLKEPVEALAAFSKATRLDPFITPFRLQELQERAKNKGSSQA